MKIIYILEEKCKYNQVIQWKIKIEWMSSRHMIFITNFSLIR